ncbi:NFX1-type zinc finger-containing protein 1-like [Homalodisca vitripennis]|uniref:NFX1-type zinc finger-containing protein 1-like n=1 Tax=Homalodisca vitripennis TaxID=197043 RepID=UPI001EEAC3BA|nr:NFX1-type zinc finger-containing protein 1-like [Homalodisca vitripennis]XP_046668355.1 NFX1-type zinc finger-containing protein 1-like [Homalodisca vitripennis]XP_046668357.1 NFX1-type zinc finger-containing protein 1-like [Homalodisca vitripennis]
MEEGKKTISENFFSLLDNLQSTSDGKKRDGFKERNETSKSNFKEKKYGTSTNRVVSGCDGSIEKETAHTQCEEAGVKKRRNNNKTENCSRVSSINIRKNNDHQRNRFDNSERIQTIGKEFRKTSDGRQSLEYNNLNESSEDRHKHIQSRKSDKGCNIMGYKILENLLTSDTSVILTTLASPRSGFQELLNSRPLRADLLMLIVCVLEKVKDSEIHHLKIQVFSQAFTPEFFDEIKRFAGLICIEDKPDRLKSIEAFFMNILYLFEMLINLFPSMMNEKLKSVMVTLRMSMKNAKDVQGLTVKECLFELAKIITDQIESYIENSKKVEKEQQSDKGIENKVPNKFRDLPLIPVKDDFLSDKPFLRQNVVKGSYKDVEQYLDIQFRLLREDFIAPIRAGIYEYIENVSTPHMKRKYTSVKIYPKVQFQYPYKSRDTFGFLINFDCDKKLPRNINWEWNKRFMVGNLLLFSNDHFQTFYLATVVERDLKHLQQRMLCVTFIPGSEVPEYIFEPGVFFVMAESEVYYEAYRHVLAALKLMTESNFPMKQYIVDVDTACFPPVYLVYKSTYKISGFNVNVLEEESWPSPNELSLNPSQHQAFKSALTNDFVVIQGPPGTGKTFLALKITEVLLKNKVSEDAPIVVICYTNHALDQFLEGILQHTQNLIRIGSQSQNEALEKYNIDKIRREKRMTRTHNFSALYREVQGRKSDLWKVIDRLRGNLEEINNLKGILEFSILKSVINPRHFNELSDQEVEWLLCQDSPNLFSAEEDSQEYYIPTESEDQNEKILNVNDFEEEFEEEIDDENTRRIADMIDDDIDVDDYLKEENYSSTLKYFLKIESLTFEIENLELELRKNLNSNFLNEKQKMYLQLDVQGTINEINWQITSIQKQFFKFKDYKFNPEKHSIFENTATLWDMNLHDRWEYYMGWLYLYSCHLKQAVQFFSNQYQEVVMKLHELKQLDDVSFVRNAAVVGLTTSGAAKRRVLLENLNTKIVIVEEAAEVLEAHIVSSLTKSVQHVILIGDHKQLKPKPAVYQLAKKYGMEVSLFERMLKNGLGCSVLGVQHRMRPEIASLIVPTIYPSLANHPSTFDRPRVSGIDKFVFFLTHNKPEDQLPDSSSKQNTYEADFLIALCQYLLLQGYKPDEITILATYSGQVWCLRKEKRRLALQNPDWRNVRITAVDNFQGEENRIILLSLVRSNTENRIGFLSEENRVCVALSRARDGLYIVGNMDNLTASSAIWPRIKQQLEEIGAVGGALTLRCERHPSEMIQVSTAQQFSKSPQGGCLLKCDTILECGHLCPRVCHIIDRYHTEYKCSQSCERRPCEVENHKCPLRCSETCQPCVILVRKQLPCGHSTELPCHVEPASVRCKEPVQATLPSCGHLVWKPCYQDPELSFCSEPCTSRLPCGHACVWKCHVENDPDHLEYRCLKECTNTNTNCRRNHACPKKCYEKCGDCPVLIQIQLPCGHRQKMACSQDETLISCMKTCTKTLPCGHKCPFLCSVDCDPKRCVQLVDKEGTCGHVFEKLKCNEGTESRKCLKRCTRKLPCGHPCHGTCWKDCTSDLCREMVVSTVTPACGHTDLLIPCHLNISVVNQGSDELLQCCNTPCKSQLPCGHDCAGVCGACMQGRLHMPCTESCNKELICGHICKAKCNVLCPPCTSKGCFSICNHTKCSGLHPCNKLCYPCTRRCSWQCEHERCTKQCGEECDRPPCDRPCTTKLECGHLCIGYCGEMHPPLCHECNKEDPLISANPEARFVVLEDCNHIIESGQLQELVTTATQGGGMKLLRCPKCNQPIVKTMRCRNIYIRLRKQLGKINSSVTAEVNRLNQTFQNYLQYFQREPTNSALMNNLVSDCTQKVKGAYQRQMAQAVILCLLQPLVTQYCGLQWTLNTENRLTRESSQRLRIRLDYLAKCLQMRLFHISYQDILHIELEVTRILRILEFTVFPELFVV